MADPKLRFPYKEIWRKRKLSDKFYIKSRIGWQKLTKSEYLKTGDYLLITGVDFCDNFGVDYSHCYYVSKERYEKDENIQLQNGDVIITKDGTIGKVAILKDLPKPATLNSHLFVVRDLSGEVNNVYLAQIFNSHLFTNYVSENKSGTTLTGLPQKDFIGFTFPLPCKEEQDKIAAFLSSIDSKLETEQKELKNLELAKKGFMQKIFSQELRFKDDNGNNYPEWKCVKLKDCATGFSYGMNAAACEYDGNNKYIRITDIDDLSRKYNADKISSPSGILEDKYIVQENDILFARTGASVGKSYIYNNEDGKLYYAGFLIRIHVNENCSSKFVFYQTLTEQFSKWITLESMRSGQPGINAEQYKEYEFMMPSLQEQEKIAAFLSSIDSLIDKQRKIVEDWKEIKKGFLQQLFPSEE